MLSAGPRTIHATNVATAITITTGTKMPLIRSASRWIGALPPCARSTAVMIPANTVSAPTADVRTTSEPLPLSVPPMTGALIVRSTGILSPVTIDSSMVECPSMMMPSRGMRSPGRIMTRSPTTTSSMATSVGCPSRSTRAEGGRSSIRRCSASAARPLARVSRKRPTSTRVMIVAVVSRYAPTWCWVAATASGARMVTAL